MTPHTTTSVGAEIYALARDIYPICRSITGDGVRQTLQVLKRHAPIKTHEIASGTSVFDWTVPREWIIREAYIAASDGTRVVDFRNHTLHVLNYSAPIRQHMTLAELKPHLHTLPDDPDLIPYRTSYYEERWGFCITQTQKDALPNDTYEVVVDSEFKNGALTWGEYLHQGKSDDEVLLTAHICHPSLANDNCSGLALLTRLCAALCRRSTKLSYRFLFAPGTIGAISWLAQNEHRVDRVKHGLVLSCVGDGGGPIYKQSRRGDAIIDRAMAHVISHSGLPGRVVPFSPYGYDERQFGSPAFDMPVGLFQRSAFGTFREYHTSADNLDFIAPDHLAISYDIVSQAIDILEGNNVFINLNPKCEPQLGRRGLYGTIGGDKDAPKRSMAMLWVLNLSDGNHTLLDIAERADLPFSVIAQAGEKLLSAGLLAEAETPSGRT
ncbi:MAG: peptidase M28 [Hyphomicrobium sp.]|nr:MAG: peptidase M28 [Hyphomicrobium sp.]PPD01590.1 MAG: peptidase M28 [Hyphomicrobium sp.]